MTRIPLLGGSYNAESVIANAQTCIGLYPEVNPQDASAPLTHYPTPGLITRAQGTPGEVRGLYRSSQNGTPFAVIGHHVYFVSPSFVLVDLGTIGTSSGIVSMIDNGTTLILVDGSTSGYQIDLVSLVMTPIVDAAFYGSNFVQYQDTFLIYNRPDSRQFYMGPANAVTPFDPTWIASKTAYPDDLYGAFVLHREIWLIGTLKTEIWFNSGAPAFPFEIVQGAYIEHGCRAQYSIARSGGLGQEQGREVALFFLGRDLEGDCVAYRGAGYKAVRISTHAVEQEWQKYTITSDAIGFAYQQNGHVFYQLTFPDANTTWCWDDTSGFWHRRGWTDSDGVLNRHRANCHAFFYNRHIVGDWENGKIYELSTSAYDDAGDPITRTRAFPHLAITQGAAAVGYQQFDGGKRIEYISFAADMECGTLEGSETSDPPQVSLRWSDDAGKTWSNPVMQSMGALGQYSTQPKWWNLGMGRQRVFELSWSVAAKTALNGAFIEAREAET